MDSHKEHRGTEWDNVLDFELGLVSSPEVVHVNKNTIRLGRITMNPTKNLFKSKTFWTNVALVAGAAATEAVGAQLPVGDTTALSILGLINVGLRLFTNQGVTVMPQEQKF